MRGGRVGNEFLAGADDAQAAAAEEKRRDFRIDTVRVDNAHTGEPVVVAARGPGAARVKGFMKNTDLFRVMLDAFGWTP